MAKRNLSSRTEETYSKSKLKRVLLIDDGSSVMSFLQEHFSKNGNRGITAFSLTSAKDIITTQQLEMIIVSDGGSEFVVNNFQLLEQTKIIILTESEVRQISNYNKLTSLGVRIIRKDPNPNLVLDKILNENYQDIFIDDAETPPEDEVPTNSSQQSIPTTNEGISPHIASDLWTTEDALGYEDYAYAIYKFMTHPKTKPPLTISIQAPWGGGKTSLMRMVRKFIDPEVDSQLKKAAQHPNGELKLYEALEEIKKWISQKANRKPLEDQGKINLENNNQKANNLTVWFNAWKYENTNQVWAGLIDTVMQQVAARLPVKERELFWLRLNLKRVDTDKIRKKIHDRIFNYFLRGILFWVTGLLVVILPVVLIALGYQFNLLGIVFDNLTSGLSLSLIGTLLIAAGKYLQAHIKVNNEPAVVSLNDYLEIPNYSAEIGFIHRAEIDLKHVLESIPEQYKPLVIFIDDLDRCSPTKISQVVEAVNLFLAGDFPHCLFVIGMDTEMVAAALQSAHKDMIANLPADLGIPVGWRFMDKFVQLPFLIPPSQRYTKNYVDSLFNINQGSTEHVSEETQKKIMSLIQQRIEQNPSYGSIEEETKNRLEKKEISDAEAPHFQRNLQLRLKQTIIDKGIQSFTDKNQEIRELMDNAKVFDYFTGSPRELKRFVNAFRFNYFLWWAQRSQGSEVVSLEQLLRWTVLSMKWAEVIRWLRRGDGSEWLTTPTNEKSTISKVELVARLKLLEEASIESQAFSPWQDGLAKKFQLDLKSTNWLNDEDLFQFFRKEAAIQDGERLSDGIGKGIW
jgi:hypothetical protein